MSLLRRLEEVVRELERRQVQFALAGGLVASLYRETPRATNDVDIAILSPENGERLASELVLSFGLEPRTLRKAQLEGGPQFAIKRKSTPVQIVVGRASAGKPESVGLDFLLPALPWVEVACHRAQANRVDFGFGAIPCLTVEDVVIAKLCSVANQTTRFNDLDDLKSIFETGRELDLSYLGGRIGALELSFPKAIEEFVPRALRRVVAKGQYPRERP